MNVVITHVYSRSNRGDGLLAELTVEVLRDALGVEPRLLAIDASELDGYQLAAQYGGSPRSVRGAVREVLAACGLGSAPGVAAINDADLVVAIGGGYLRSRGLRGAITLTAAHLPQLLAETRRNAAPVVFMPQSIGPLPIGLKQVVYWRLRRAAVVFLRDDRSVLEHRRKQSMSGVHVLRVPDLAVMEVARRARHLHRSSGSEVLVQARAVRNAPLLEHELRAFLVAASRPFDLAIQSDAGGANDDRSFMSRVAPGRNLPILGDLLGAGQGRFGVAICGRLHAALECLLNGVPAIHLGYERKSFAAFDDLGLAEFVIPARRVRAQLLDALVLRVLTDPQAYWERVDSAAAEVRSTRDDLMAELGLLAASLSP